MNSLKAIITGVLFIIITTLLMQLAYLFIAVGYHNLTKTYPYLNEITTIFRYLVAIPIFIAIMFSGGYLTALIAKSKVIIHSATVGIITIAVMMWSALENADLTSTGIVINILMLLAVVAGGLFWKKRAEKSGLTS